MTDGSGCIEAWRHAAAAVCGLFLLAASPDASSAAAKQAVDLELVIATDVSYSIDEEEATLQRQGTIDAFRSPEVIRAITSGVLGRIAVAYIDFSSRMTNRIVLDWQIIGDSASANAFADRLAATSLTHGMHTSISDGIELARQLIEMSPIEATLMVALPELDGATMPMVFGGRSAATAPGASGTGYEAIPERVDRLAARVARQVALRHRAVADRTVAIVLFNFPPNAGNTGTAAYLGVFESAFNLLRAMAEAGYTIDVPASVDDLREQVTRGNAEQFGAAANVLAKRSTSSASSSRGQIGLRDRAFQARPAELGRGAEC